MVSGLQKRRPDAGVFKVTDEDFLSDESGEEKLTEFISGQGLFGGNYIVICDGIYAFAKEFVDSRMKDMSDAEHVFVFLEGSLNKTEVKKFEKKGAKVEEFGKASKAKDDFNIFSIGDALGQRDKKKLWTLYVKALDGGIASEQIQGTLFWQIKTLLLIKSSPDKNPGLNPFVFKKGKNFSQNWQTEELEALSSGLLELHHNVRSEGGNHELLLEKWVLSI